MEMIEAVMINTNDSLIVTNPKTKLEDIDKTLDNITIDTLHLMIVTIDIIKNILKDVHDAMVHHHIDTIHHINELLFDQDHLLFLPLVVVLVPLSNDL